MAMEPLTREQNLLPQAEPGVPADTTDPMPGADADRRERFREAALPLLDGLYRFAVRMTRSQEDAEALVHDALVRAYRSLHTFEQGTSFRVWAFRVLADTFAGEYRQRAARRPYTVGHEAAESTALDPEHVAPGKLHPDTVLAAIDKLPHRYRVVLTLADVEGFRYQQVAEIVGCPISTVRLCVSRARYLLRRHLWAYLRDEGTEPADGGVEGVGTRVQPSLVGGEEADDTGARGGQTLSSEGPHLAARLPLGATQGLGETALVTTPTPKGAGFSGNRGQCPG